MPAPELLAARIRGEYREMPGLRLTFAQACRVWQVDPAACEIVLQTLLDEKFLAQTGNGAFVALPTPAGRLIPVEAVRGAIGATDSHLRRPA